jgi:hypothetical protein
MEMTMNSIYQPDDSAICALSDGDLDVASGGCAAIRLPQGGGSFPRPSTGPTFPTDPEEPFQR